ncbi:MAG TPA: hypothetical protein VFD71_04025 [Planctomycetota bacterium]|jgi:hypothetical protein|nr:hypothetical protein [Planctomycetota bacterium]
MDGPSPPPRAPYPLDPSAREPKQPAEGASDEIPLPEAVVDRIAEEYFDDLRAGRVPDLLAVVALHPDLARALRRRLRLMEVLHRHAQRE